MNESASIGGIVGPMVWLAILWGLYRLLFSNGGNPAGHSPRAAKAARAQGAAPAGSPLYRERLLVAVADNPHDHPYDELSLTDLHDHLFTEHFEVYNLLGEHNPMPAKWRKEHAADHGLVIR